MKYLIFTVSCLLNGCQSLTDSFIQSENAGFKVEQLYGTWTSTKKKISDSYWIHSVLRIDRSGASLSQKHFLSCEIMELCLPTQTYLYTFSDVQVYSSNGNVQKLQLTTKDIYLTVYEQLTIEINNEDSYYGKSDWKLNETVNVTGKLSGSFDKTPLANTGEIARILVQVGEHSMKVAGLFVEPNLENFPPLNAIKSPFAETYTIL